jgi:hypothetical protein
MIGTV